MKLSDKVSSNNNQDSGSTQDKPMLLKYVLAWNELAISQQDNHKFFESLQAFLTAIQIYNKLNMRVHVTFAIGDFSLSKLHIISS
jgi:hypothetical protein